MTRSTRQQLLTLTVLLLTTVGLLVFALSAYSTTGADLQTSAAGSVRDRPEQSSRLGRFPHRLGQSPHRAPAGFRVVSKVATSTVHLPLVLRNWPAISHPKVVWGTQFGPHQEEQEILYSQLVERELPLVQAAGFTSIRTHLQWRDVEPVNTTPEAYDWSKYDQHLRDFRNAGLEPVVSIVGYPLWAVRYYCGGGLLPGMQAEFVAAANDSDRAESLDETGEWREFVRALAQRYSVPPYDVHIWEIGNEVDGETEVDPDEDSQRPPEQGGNQPTWPYGGCWGDMAPDYVTFLRAAYQEIKAVDPSATVMLGGLAYAAFEDWFIRDFFDDFLAAGGGAYTDVVGFHWFPYRQPWSTVGEKAQELRSIMAAHGVSKPLWLTETYMWDRENGTDTRDLRVAFITQELPRALGSGAVERIHWFGFWDFDPEISSWDRGLVTVNHEPKPGLRVFEIMADFVNGHPYPPTAIPPQIEAYRFIQPWKNQETWAIWSMTGQVETVPLSVLGSSVEAVQIEVGDTYTSTHAISTTVPVEDGQITLSVGPQTLFLRVE